VAVNLPARLSIHVSERKVQFVCEAGGESYVADEHGIVLGGAVAPPDALLIRCTEGSVPVDGHILDQAVLDTVKGLSQLLGEQRVFEYSPRHGVSWRNDKGWLVRFGVGGDLHEKLTVMQSMTAELEDKGIQPEFLDVGVPSRPFYRLKEFP